MGYFSCKSQCIVLCFTILCLLILLGLNRITHKVSGQQNNRGCSADVEEQGMTLELSG